jgi:hypothetical protein
MISRAPLSSTVLLGILPLVACSITACGDDAVELPNGGLSAGSIPGSATGVAGNGGLPGLGQGRAREPGAGGAGPASSVEEAAVTGAPPPVPMAPPAGAAGDCSGAFALAPAPYAPITSIEDWGGFIADERGLVFSAIPDTQQTQDTAAYRTLIIGSDTSGNLRTLYTLPEGALVGPIFAVGEDVFFVSGLLNRTIMRMPRGGGDATPVIEDRLWAGPARQGDTLYYAARPSFDSSAVYALDPATSTSTLLSDRGDTEIAAIAVDRGVLYWVETDGVLAETDNTLFSMPVGGGTPAVVMTFPRATALGSFRVVDQVAYGDTITASFDIEIHRTPLGQPTQVVASSAGLPLVISDGKAYYNSSQGLTINSLAFDAPSIVDGTAGRPTYAITTSATELWYALGPCIFRTAK